jgi:hypothetical protein
VALFGLRCDSESAGPGTQAARPSGLPGLRREGEIIVEIMRTVARGIAEIAELVLSEVIQDFSAREFRN